MRTLTLSRRRSEEATAPAPAAAPTPTSALPTPVRARRTRRLLVGVVLLALVAAAVVAARGALDATEEANTADPARPATPTTAAPAPDPVQAELDALVTELQAHVEGVRDLEFLRPVRAVLLDDAAYARMIAGEPMEEWEIENLRDVERVLEALTLVDPEYDLVTEWSEPMEGAGGYLGHYDSATETLYVRGSKLTPAVRATVVHELVHALDDQHFGLDSIGAEGALEELIAAKALIEGNASRVEDAYVEAMTGPERAELEAETQANLAEDAQTEPQTVDYFSAFPYVDGAHFVRGLLEHGGERAVDRAFGRPPRTTAEVLEPDRFLEGLTGARLSPPVVPDGGRLVESGMFGELGLILLLADAVGLEEAAFAAIPWEGDSYVAYEQGERMCVSLRFLLEDEWSTEQTSEILAAWADQQIDATVEAPGTVLVTSCR